MMTHVFNAILGYIIMLAVMQYNWWIFIAVLLGKYYESLLRRDSEKQKNIYMKMYAAFRGYSSEASEIIKGKILGKNVLFDIF